MKPADYLYVEGSSSILIQPYGISIDARAGRIYTLLRTSELSSSEEIWTVVDAAGPFKSPSQLILSDPQWGDEPKQIYRISVKLPE